MSISETRGAHPAEVQNSQETSSNQVLRNRKTDTKQDDLSSRGNASPAKLPRTPDMYSPLVWAIHEYFDDKETYLQWVHTPFSYSAKNARQLEEMGVTDPKKLKLKSPRLFHSDFFEAFSNTHWWVIPLVWLPVAAYFMSPLINILTGKAPNTESVTNLFEYVLPPGAAKVAFPLTLISIGLFFWTLVEYGLHRFLFHVDSMMPEGPAKGGPAIAPWLYTIHFLIHGVHHKVPRDNLRLVMPPALLTPLAAGVHLVFRNLVLWWVSQPVYTFMFGAGLIGYVLYDVTHYALHHLPLRDGEKDEESEEMEETTLNEGGLMGSAIQCMFCFFRPLLRYLRSVKRIHMAHHYKNHEKDFGITSRLWDIVFGT